MSKLCISAFFIIAFCTFTIAQTEENADCPTLYVTGPAGIVMLNDVSRYTATVDAKGRVLNLEYIWSVSTGEIVSGQGTPSIEIKRSELSGLTATLEVKGFPAGCANTASETSFMCNGLPIAEKLVQFTLSTSAENRLKLNQVIRVLADNRNDQLYVFLTHKEETTQEKRSALERRIFEYLTTGGVDGSRITLHSQQGIVELAQFWRVPPGADDPRPPLLEDLGKIENEDVCPMISVIGPQGLTRPGDGAVFMADVKGYESKHLIFSWAVSLGKVVSGESSKRIEVEVPHDINNGILKAAVEIGGLPQGCPSTANAESVIHSGVFDVFPIDVYGEVKFQVEKARLDNFAIHVQNAPGDMKGYIIKKFKNTVAERDIKRRIDRIKKFLFTYRKYPKEKFVILVRRADEVSTTLWLWPSDGSIPPL